MRAISQQEEPLIRYLYNKAGLECDISAIRVQPMIDGGMGSLRIGTCQADDQHFGSCASECSFYDTDEIQVIASLYFDQYGQPFEIDVWKVDYSPLNSLPTLADINSGQ